MVLSGLGLLFDLLSLKFRMCCQTILYIELSFFLILPFSPNSYFSQLDTFLCLVLQFCVFLSFYCASAIQLIYSTAVAAAYCFIVVPVAYDIEVNFSIYLRDGLQIFVLFVIYVGFAMLTGLVPSI